DKGEKEPWKLMRRAFIWGVLVVFPVVILEVALHIGFYSIPNLTPLYFIVGPFFLIALPEELGKFWVVKRKIFDHAKFNEVMDGINYTVVASLGFAALENIMYIYAYDLEIGVLRAFTAVPAHALFSGLMGYKIGRAKFEKNKKKRNQLLRQGLWAAVFFHGLYDFLLMSGEPLLIFMIFPLLFVMWRMLHNRIRLAHR
ncbi:MAG: PrsW family glutamic-type intramembrane protease, partial [Patescibacteria group bacterium]